MLHRLVVRLAALVGFAGILLGVSEWSEHRVPLLPADASAAGVLPAAVLAGIVASVVAEAMRRRTSSGRR